jgi:hypothetical protein
MTITERITYEDLEVYEILRNPILCGEFHRNMDIPEWSEDEWEYSDYQKEYLGDFGRYVSLCCGRAVGKTVTLTDLIVWYLINSVFPQDYLVYTVPSKVHLEPVWFSLIKAFRNNDLLKHFVESKKGINSSNFTIRLLNASELICRIAGQSGTGANVVGLHSPIVILDEAGYYPWGTWVELQPVLNSWQEGMKLFISGVPTGMRENNVLYYADEVDDKFSHHRTSAHENPRYSDADEERNLKQYHGVDGEDYIHLVLGRHGSPVHAVFDRRLMKITDYPVYKVKANGIDDSQQEIIGKIALLPPVPEHDIKIMGIDTGYTEPTAIVILYEHKNVLKIHARIELSKVKYNIQEKIFDFIDSRLGPFEIIAIDAGNEQGLVHHLQNDDEYLHKNYKKRLYSVKFGQWLTLGTTPDGEEIRSKTKPYSVSILQEYTNSHKIIYTSTDLDLITEMERMTYSKTPTGEIVYRTLTPKGGKRGADHFTSAMLCASLTYALMVEGRLFSQKKPKLAGSRWVRGH